MPIICLFGIWQWLNVLPYKTHFLEVYQFLLSNSGACVYVLAGHRSDTSRGCLRVRDLILSQVDSTVAPTSIANFSKRPILVFVHVLILYFLDIHQFIRTVPGTFSSTCDIFCTKITLYRDGLNLKDGYSSTHCASWSILNSTWTLVPTPHETHPDGNLNSPNTLQKEDCVLQCTVPQKWQMHK